MLFRDEELLSDFDFGNKIRDEQGTLKSLADNIYEIVQRMIDKEQPVLFRHTDNYGNPLYVIIHKSKGEDEIYDRRHQGLQSYPRVIHIASKGDTI